MMGIARRAGKLLAGMEAVTSAVKRGNAFLIIFATDLSVRTRVKLANLAQAHMVPIIPGCEMKRLGISTGHPGKGVFAVISKELARAVMDAWKPEPDGSAGEGGVSHSSRQDKSTRTK